MEKERSGQQKKRRRGTGRGGKERKGRGVDEGEQGENFGRSIFKKKNDKSTVIEIRTEGMEYSREKEESTRNRRNK